MHVCYEAEGCGMWIARRLAQLKVRCTVVAPSLIPSKAGDQVKTDKKDAIKLARLLRAGELVAVHVPDETDEAMKTSARLESGKHLARRTLQSGTRGERLQTRTRRTFWDKMHLAKVIERPFRDWNKVEW